MSTDVAPKPAQAAARIPVHRTIGGLIRDPLKTFEEIGREHGGQIFQLDLGTSRPYVVSRPDHIQHILRDNGDNYVREGMMWQPLRRLFGHGLGMDGPAWARSRQLIQPVFSAKYVATVMDELTAALTEAVDELDRYARSGQPIDTRLEMTRIIHRALIRVFFGGGMTVDEADRLGEAITGAFTSIGARLLVPWAPNWLPLPGDAAFRRSVRLANEIVTPLVAERRRSGRYGRDMVSLLCQARDEEGNPLDDRQVRDDTVAMFAGASETSAVALTWLWVVLDEHPRVAERLYDEIDRVVGAERPGPRHVPDLAYTRMVLNELLRLRPVAWIIPRTARDTDVVDGTVIKAGGTVLVSPYLTHRIAGLWDRPDVFDPERFAPDRAQRRDKLAYLPFGVGAHQCLGSHFFTVEAQLIVAIMLSRYRPVLRSSRPVVPQAAATLRPRGRVDVILRPVTRD